MIEPNVQLNFCSSFLALVFFLASVDCSSRVLYLPFMAKFQSSYLTPYFIGEGMSSFVPSIFALVQGVGGNPECRNETINGTSVIVAFIPEPLFSVEIFFSILLILTLLSGVAFFLLNCESIVFKALAPKRDINKNRREEPTSQELLISAANPLSTTEYQSTGLENGRPTNDSDIQNAEGSGSGNNDNPSTVLYTPSSVSVTDAQSVPESEYMALLFLLAVTSALSNGVFPSIQPYSCLPYGNVAYHWTVTLSSMSNPGICFFLLYIKTVTKENIFWVSLLSLFFGVYIVFTAVSSPFPPLRDSISGQVLLVNF